VDDDDQQGEGQQSNNGSHPPTKKSRGSNACEGPIDEADIFDRPSDTKQRLDQLVRHCPHAIFEAYQYADVKRALNEMVNQHDSSGEACVLGTIQYPAAYSRAVCLLKAVVVVLSESRGKNQLPRGMYPMYLSTKASFLTTSRRLLAESPNKPPTVSANPHDAEVFSWVFQGLNPSNAPDGLNPQLMKAAFFALVQLTRPLPPSKHFAEFGALTAQEYLQLEDCCLSIVDKDESSEGWDVVHRMHPHCRKCETNDVAIGHHLKDAAAVLLCLTISWYRFFPRLQPCEGLTALRVVLLRLFVHREITAPNAFSSHIWEVLQDAVERALAEHCLAPLAISKVTAATIAATSN
jgi:hypothetical protein